MRTTINVEDEIFKDIMRLTEAKTKTEAVNKALAEYVRFRKKQDLLSLSGKIKIDEDYRKLREREKYER